ncbi:MAG: DUF3237 family protein [Candidatus Zixiibacteriota bacterium]
MGASEITVGEFLYEAEVSFTEVVEYGVSLKAVLSGNVSVPTAGARFDVHFRGVLRGPRLSGTVAGVDYLYVRADGRGQLHIHAQITTEDSQNIAFFADGVALRQEGTTVWQLRENVSFITESSTYAWLNQLQGWGQGTVDPGKGEVKVKAYAA